MFFIYIYLYERYMWSDSMKDKIKQKIKSLALCGIIIVAAYMGVPKVVTVTNTENGKELPIFFVIL